MGWLAWLEITINCGCLLEHFSIFSPRTPSLCGKRPSCIACCLWPCTWLDPISNRFRFNWSAAAFAPGSTLHPLPSSRRRYKFTVWRMGVVSPHRTSTTTSWTHHAHSPLFSSPPNIPVLLLLCCVVGLPLPQVQTDMYRVYTYRCTSHRHQINKKDKWPLVRLCVYDTGMRRKVCRYLSSRPNAVVKQNNPNSLSNCAAQTRLLSTRFSSASARAMNFSFHRSRTSTRRPL